MDPQTQFCPDTTCPARGKTGQGNILIHSRKDARYKRTACGKTFAATTGTPFYRLHHSLDLVTCFIKRLNATFRSRPASLARRPRALLRNPEPLTPLVYLMGSVYNFCTNHQSLPLKLSVGFHGLPVD